MAAVVPTRSLDSRMMLTKSNNYVVIRSEYVREFIDGGLGVGDGRTFEEILANIELCFIFSLREVDHICAVVLTQAEVGVERCWVRVFCQGRRRVIHLRALARYCLAAKILALRRPQNV